MKNKKGSKAKQFAKVFFSRGLIVKICFAIIALFILVAIFAPILTPHEPTRQNLKMILQDL